MLDLHTHSIYSDGTDTPTEIIDKALALDIKYISITDHDTVAGIDEAQSYCQDKNITFIPGAEFSIDYKKGIFHLLGLGIDHENSEITKLCNLVKIYRNERNIEMFNRLKENGYDISIDDVENKNSIGRPHIAALLLEKGYVKHVKDVYKNVLGPSSPCYVSKKNIELEKAIKAIKEANGLAIIAHPLSLNLSWEKLENYLIELKELGIDGLEVFHSGYSLVRCRRLESLAIKLDLIMTAGSDYHGKNKPGISLGKKMNKSKIELTYLPEYLKNKYCSKNRVKL